MEQLLLALGTALLASVGTWATLSVTRRKISAEGTSIITKAAVELVEPLRTEIEGLRERVYLIEHEMEVWRRLAKMRGDQIRANGDDPIPFEVALEAVGARRLR